MKFRKKPVVIEAYMFAGGASEPGWPTRWLSVPHTFSSDGENVLIPTLEGVMQGGKGDYIIRVVQGEFYPCKPDIFNKTYEVADTPANPNEFADVRAVMAKHFEDMTRGCVRHSYIANISMLLSDNYPVKGAESHEKAIFCDEMAEKLMKLIFD